MKKIAFLLLFAAIVAACSPTAADSLDEQYVSFVATDCAVTGKLGNSPVNVIENCLCVAEVAANSSTPALKRFVVENREFPKGSDARAGSGVNIVAFIGDLKIKCPEAHLILEQYGSVTAARDRAHGY